MLEKDSGLMSHSQAVNIDSYSKRETDRGSVRHITKHVVFTLLNRQIQMWLG